MERDIFERVREQIACRKPVLEYFWSHEPACTADAAGDGAALISMASWKEGLQAALPGLGALPYLHYRRSSAAALRWWMMTMTKVPVLKVLQSGFQAVSAAVLLRHVEPAVGLCRGTGGLLLLIAADLSAMANLFDSTHDGVVTLGSFTEPSWRSCTATSRPRRPRRSFAT